MFLCNAFFIIPLSAYNIPCYYIGSLVRCEMVLVFWKSWKIAGPKSVLVKGWVALRHLSRGTSPGKAGRMANCFTVLHNKYMNQCTHYSQFVEVNHLPFLLKCMFLLQNYHHSLQPLKCSVVQGNISHLELLNNQISVLYFFCNML